MTLPARAADLTVFAAASLGDVLNDIAQDWQDKQNSELRIVLAGSATLARQIEAAAPADIYLSANTDWMDWLEQGGHVVAESRVDVAANRLVLVTNDDQNRSEAILDEDTIISELLGADGRLAIALPEAVPAGIYARQALTALGQWDDLVHRLAPTDNVRAALSLVALGEAPIGVVYQTDAIAEARVALAGVFPDTLHDPILYPAAIVATSDHRTNAQEFLDFLMSDEGQAAFADHGFLPVGASD